MNMNIEEERRSYEEQAEQVARNIVQLNAVAMLDEPEKFIGRKPVEGADPDPGVKADDQFGACVLQTKVEVLDFTNNVHEDNEKLMRRINRKDESLREVMRLLESVDLSGADDFEVTKMQDVYAEIKNGLNR